MSDERLTILNPMQERDHQFTIILALLREALRGRDMTLKPFLLARRADNVVKDLKMRGFGAKRGDVLRELNSVIRDLVQEATEQATVVQLDTHAHDDAPKTGH